MHPIEKRIEEIKVESIALRQRADALDSLLPGLEEGLRMLKASNKSLDLFPVIQNEVKSPSIDKMKGNTKITQILKILKDSAMPLQSQEIATKLGLSDSKPVRANIHIAKNKGLVAAAGNRDYKITELGNALLQKKSS